MQTVLIDWICSSGSWRQLFDTTRTFVTRDRRTSLTARNRNDLWQDGRGSAQMPFTACIRPLLYTNNAAENVKHVRNIENKKTKFFLPAFEPKTRVASFPVSPFIFIFRNASAFRPSQIQQRSRDRLNFSRGLCLGRILFRQHLWPVN